MIYVLSDIHGNKPAFDSVMKQINLQPDDKLYVIGDVIDRGPNGIEILKQLFSMENVIVLLGNHELMMLHTLADEYYLQESYPIFKNRSAWRDWRSNGGMATVEELKKMEKAEINKIVKKIRAMPLSEQIEVNGTTYEPVHGLPPECYNPDKMIVFCQHKRRTDESSFQKIICSPKLFNCSKLH